MKGSKVKITVSLDPDVAAQLREAVIAGRTRSVSAYVEHAVRSQFAAETEFDALIEEMLAASGGPITDEERAEAMRLLGDSVA